MLSMQALAELLKVTHRGYFIPPRPEKNPVEGQRASNDFVELRRHALEKYLIQLASHPAIVQSDVSDWHTELLDSHPSDGPVLGSAVRLSSVLLVSNMVLLGALVEKDPNVQALKASAHRRITTLSANIMMPLRSQLYS